MKKLWQQTNPYLHVAGWLITALIAATLWYGDVSASIKQTARNTEDIAELKTALAVMSQKLTDLWHDNGHRE